MDGYSMDGAESGVAHRYSQAQNKPPISGSHRKLPRSTSTQLAAEDLGAIMDRSLNIHGQIGDSQPHQYSTHQGHYSHGHSNDNYNGHGSDPKHSHTDKSDSSSRESSPRLLPTSFAGRVQTPLRKALRSVTSHHHSKSRSNVNSQSAKAVSPTAAGQYPGKIGANVNSANSPYDNAAARDLSPRKQYVMGGTHGSSGPNGPAGSYDQNTIASSQSMMDVRGSANDDPALVDRYSQQPFVHPPEAQQNAALYDNGRIDGYNHPSEGRDAMPLYDGQTQQMQYEHTLREQGLDLLAEQQRRYELERERLRSLELDVSQQQAAGQENMSHRLSATGGSHPSSPARHSRPNQDRNTGNLAAHPYEDLSTSPALQGSSPHLTPELPLPSSPSRASQQGAVQNSSPVVQSPQLSMQAQLAANSAKSPSQPRSSKSSAIIKKGVEDFDFKDELGSGSYSTVVAASDKQTLRQYAIKVLDKAHIIKEQKVKYVEIEKRTLNRLGDHPGIIHLYFTFQDRASLYFVLDFAPNGELLHLIKKIGSLDEKCARYYACQILDAIKYMHSRGVIHRDLKPENILLDYKMRIKITDFGTAKLLDADSSGSYPSDCRANSFVGTAEYVTPELLVNKTQGKSADIWAFGCVLYQMIAASPPFQGATQYLTFQRIARLQYSIPPGFPFLVRDLLRHVLVSSRQRWNVDQIMSHPFFEGVDWSRKAIWGSGPPRLQPYRPSSSSMNPRGRNTPSPHQKSPSVSSPPSSIAQSQSTAQSSPSVVPTAAGLQPVKPTTRAGMPRNHILAPPSAPPVNGTTHTRSHTNATGSSASQSHGAGHHSTSQSSGTDHSQHGGPKLAVKRHQAPRPTTSASAAAAALSKASSGPQRDNHHSAPSGAYVQGQERINQIMRRVQEHKTSGKPIQLAPVTTREVEPQPESPRSPLLPQRPVSQIEGDWSVVLISSAERILKIGSVWVHIGSNPTAENPTGSAPKDDSLLAKLFSAKKKLRTVMVTTAGRLLVTDTDKKIRTEVPLGVPQVSVRELNHGDFHSVVVETYNRVLTIDDAHENGASSWLSAIDLSRQYYAQATAEQERNAFSAAAAAAVAVSGIGRR